MTSDNLLAGPPPILLPADPQPRAELEAGADPLDVAGRYPASALPWAVLAEKAMGDNQPVVAYAFARTGYHRSLDLLRRNGWKGHGPVPWSHEPNHGFLRSMGALARAAQAIGEEEEYVRCRDFLRETSAEAAEVLSI
ncbi:MAG: DUF3151 domain-containing protein [Actinobacteria bacterium]|nr:DUF3151 domain-containing protein [Actinomycetota bacterium]